MSSKSWLFYEFGFFGFNGISTFLGYLMPNPFFLKNSSGTSEPKAGGEIKEFLPSSRV